MANPGNRHSANCIGALSFPIENSAKTWSKRAGGVVGRRVDA